MKLTRTFTSQETEPAVRELVAKYLQSQGYEQRESEPLLNSEPLLVFERGSEQGSALSTAPDQRSITAVVQTTPNADRTTNLVASLDINTTGQSDVEQERALADEELNRLVAAVAGQPLVANPQATDVAALVRLEEKFRLEKRFKEGVNWFYWIAGLSLINTIILFAGGSLNFVVGLGVTQIVDSFFSSIIETAGSNATITARLINVAIDILIAGFFVLFGFLARRNRVGFIFGMIVYFLDGLLFLFVSDYFGFGFHLFALYGILSGLTASIKLRQKA